MMPQPFSSRQELKRDLLQEWMKKAVDWIAAHRQTFFSILGTAAVSIAVISFIVINFKNLRTQAWEKYSAGQNWMMANQPDNALNFFNEVIQNYSRTPAAIYSLLAKGDLLYQQKRYAEARESYQQCLEKKPAKILLPFVLSGLGAAQEDQGDFTAAIATYKQFVSEFPDHFLAPKIYEALARVYELSLNPEAAKEIYEKMIVAFPGSYWAEKARNRYQRLAPPPFPTGSTNNSLQSPTVSGGTP